MRHPWRTAAITLFLLATVTGGLFGDRLLSLKADTRDTIKVYTELVRKAAENYGGEVRHKDLVFASIQGLLRALDPHTSFLSPRAYEGMRERQQSSFYGLGILVGNRDGQLTVITPIEGTPASRLGIRAGDVISTIEGESTEAMPLDEAVSKLKGPKGTDVHITIVRPGIPDPIPMTVTRAEIPQTTVRQAYMLDEETGYIRLTEFSRGTGREMEDALEKLRGMGMKRLLLDLRNNGGGLLDQAIEVSELFLPQGATIVETRGRTPDSFQSFDASHREEELGQPVVVLVNQGTASAAEILSGALQDHDMGLIVGTPTWGKGLVQTVYSLSYGAGLALTTAKYYTPSGRLIQRDYSSFFDYYNYDPLGHSEEDPETPILPEHQGEAFATDLGREVYGGGGITPDVVVEADELEPFEIELLSKNTFFRFAVDLQNHHPITDASWKPGPEILQQFHDWLLAEEIIAPETLEKGWSETDVLEFARVQIHSDLFNAAFGQEAAHKILTQADDQIQAARKLFDKAAELLEERYAAQEKGSTPDVAPASPFQRAAVNVGAPEPVEGAVEAP